MAETYGPGGGRRRAESCNDDAPARRVCAEAPRKLPTLGDVTDSAREHKQTLRAMLRQQMRDLDAETISNRSAVACARLCQMDVFARASAIMIFLPFADEVDAQSLAMRAWQMGKTVTVPRVGHEQRHMIPIEIQSLGEPMQTGRFGVRTPVDGRPVPPDMLDLVVVPGLGFDESGRRLGRGGGFYDQFLTQPSFTGTTCGLALDEQIIDHVPTLGHDVILDMIVTDRRTIQINTNKSQP